MRILIDERLNWRLGRALPGHYCTSVQRMGQLLTLAQDQFDVFITGDRNLSFQQNVTAYRIAVVVLRAKGTQLHQTLPPSVRFATVVDTLLVKQQRE